MGGLIAESRTRLSPSANVSVHRALIEGSRYYRTRNRPRSSTTAIGPSAIFPKRPSRVSNGAASRTVHTRPPGLRRARGGTNAQCYNPTRLKEMQSAK